jgi:hypothetical protein
MGGIVLLSPTLTWLTWERRSGGVGGDFCGFILAFGITFQLAILLLMFRTFRPER